MVDEICLEKDNGDEIIEKLKRENMNDDDAATKAEFFKIFSDATRLKILHLLSINEVCVHEIALVLNMSQSAVSHQLKILRQNRVVKTRREKKHIYYSICSDNVLDVLGVKLI